MFVAATSRLRSFLEIARLGGTWGRALYGWGRVLFRPTQSRQRQARQRIMRRWSLPLPCMSNLHNTRQPGTATQTSVNWAGYAVTGPSVSNVAGNWAQPTATCPKNQNQQAAFWVGIDGYSATDPTVEQIGTDSDCTKATKRKPGGPNYYAWYQLYPQPAGGAQFIFVLGGAETTRSAQAFRSQVRHTR